MAHTLFKRNSVAASGLKSDGVARAYPLEVIPRGYRCLELKFAVFAKSEVSERKHSKLGGGAGALSSPLRSWGGSRGGWPPRLIFH